MADKIFTTIENGGFATNVQFDEANIPSVDEKAALAGTSGTPGAGNKFLTNSDPRVPTTDENAALQGPAGYTPSGTDRFITESYYQDKKDALDWQDSVTWRINYIKSTSGIPTGIPSSNERCWVQPDGNLWEESGGMWMAVTPLNPGDRVCHYIDGTDTTGNSGIYTKDNKIYTITSAGYEEAVPNAGFAALIESEGANGTRYTYNESTSTWVKFDSLSDHNSLSGVAGSSEGYHLSQAQYDGVNNATAVTSTNVVLTQSDRQRVPVRYSFSYRTGLGQSQTRIMQADDDILTYHLLPKAGSIIGITVASSHDCDGGQAEFKPTLDGSPVTATGVHEKLDTTDTNDEYSTVAPGTSGATFSAGQKLGCQGITDASWSTTEPSDQEDVSVDLLVVFD